MNCLTISIQNLIDQLCRRNGQEWQIIIRSGFRLYSKEMNPHTNLENKFQFSIEVILECPFTSVCNGDWVFIRNCEISNRNSMRRIFMKIVLQINFARRRLYFLDVQSGSKRTELLHILCLNMENRNVRVETMRLT